jgi:hypothetical protein
LLRWQVVLGSNQAESGSNVGSGFAIQRFTDAGVAIDLPIQIARTNGVTTFSAAIINGPSDRTLKENVTPIENALDKVLALQGVSFDWKNQSRQRDIGLIAQDVEPIVPEVMQWYDEEKKILAIDYPKLTALLIEAVKTLKTELDELKGERNGTTPTHNRHPASAPERPERREEHPRPAEPAPRPGSRPGERAGERPRSPPAAEHGSPGERPKGAGR